MNKKGATSAGILLAVMIGTSAASCDSKYTEPFKDAPRSGVDNEKPMDVIEMSDGFSNLGFKCVGHDGVYDAYHGDHPYGAIFVLANDPNCPR